MLKLYFRFVKVLPVDVSICATKECVAYITNVNFLVQYKKLYINFISKYNTIHVQYKWTQTQYIYDGHLTAFCRVSKRSRPFSPTSDFFKFAINLRHQFITVLLLSFPLSLFQHSYSVLQIAERKSV